MSTSKSQRVGIWVIAIVMAIGTVGSFFAIVLQNDNAKQDQKTQQELYAEQLKEYERQMEEAKKANRPLYDYKATAFDAKKVNKLVVEVLKKGDGKELKSDSTIVANYFGWTADGKIFDSTNKEGQDLKPAEFSLSGVIEGWTKGLTGVKVGSIVMLTIPGEQAYGNEDTGSGRPFGPLKFVVEVKELK